MKRGVATRAGLARAVGDPRLPVAARGALAERIDGSSNAAIPVLILVASEGIILSGVKEVTGGLVPLS